MKNLNVYTAPPPSSGVIANFLLGVMDQFDTKEFDFRDAVTYQRFVEACKFGFAKRTMLADWRDQEHRQELEKVTKKNEEFPWELVFCLQLVDDLASSEYAWMIRQQIRDNWTSNNVTFYGADFSGRDDAGTAHLAVLAPNGDAVSVTSTVNYGFGSGIYSKDLGLLYNNEMDDFSSPGMTNAYGIEPSPANFIKPGKRPLSSMAPLLVTDADGDVVLLAGASGGPKIVTGTAWVALLRLYGGRNVKEAIDMPRLHHQLLPMKVQYYPGKQDI